MPTGLSKAELDWLCEIKDAARELLDALDRQLGVGTQSPHVREARAALRKLLPATPPGLDQRDVAQ